MDIMVKNEERILILKPGQRIRNKRDKITYEIKYVNDMAVALLTEDGTKLLLVPVDSITPEEYEPVYN